MRFVKGFVVLLVLIGAVVSVAVVFGIPADFLASTIERQVGRATGYRMSIDGDVRVEFWPKPNVQLGKIALIDESDRGRRRLTADSVRIEAEASSLLSGRPRLTEVTIAKPKFYVPLIRERAAGHPPPAGEAAAAGEPAPFAIDRFVVADGTIVFSDDRDTIEDRLDHVEIVGTVSGPDDKITVKATARAGEQLLGVTVNGKVPGLRFEGRTIPIEFSVEAPGLLQDAAPGTAELKTKGSLLSINSLAGKIGSNKFSGWCSVDFAGKPMVKMDVDFQRLDLAVVQSPVTISGTDAAAQLDQAWSDTLYNLVGLNFFDAEIQISSAELNYDRYRFAPITIAAVLNNGVMTAAVTRAGAYGGRMQGTLAIDVSGAVPSQALRVDLIDMRALPFLTDVASFPYLDARMVAKIDVRGRGASQRAIMSSLTGAMDLRFSDGEIRDVNVAQMIRTLMASIIKGWDEKRAQKTDLSELSAFFRLEGGRATTDNLNLVGPLVRVTGSGTADIGGKTLSFKLNPKLVMTLEGQGATAPAGGDPVGFGVPVLVEGSWGSPRIYPEVSGILDDPNAAYDKLRQLGVGLFGALGKPPGPGGGGGGIPALESLFGSKDKPAARPPAPNLVPQAGSSEEPAASARPQAEARDPAPPEAANTDSASKPKEKEKDTETKIRDFIRDFLGR